MSEIDELKVQVINLQAEATYWRNRCSYIEAQLGRLEQSAGDVTGRFGQFLTVLGGIRPKGTDRQAG